MAKPPAEDPKKLPNDKREIYLRHLAIHILDKEAEDAVKARKKGNEKRATDDGIDVKKMKLQFKKSTTMSPVEIAKDYAKDFEYLGHSNIDLPTQFNLFGGADVTTKKAPDFFYVGQLAALQGKDCKPPANIKQSDSQRWIEGWNDGVSFRILGKEHKAQLDAVLAPDTQAAAAKSGDPDFDPGTTLRVPLSEFGEKALLEDIELADFDQAEVEKAARVVVYDGDKERVLKNRDAPVSGDDDFEASADELAGQTSRPSTIDSKDPGKTTLN